MWVDRLEQEGFQVSHCASLGQLETLDLQPFQMAVVLVGIADESLPMIARLRETLPHLEFPILAQVPSLEKMGEAALSMGANQLVSTSQSPNLAQAIVSSFMSHCLDLRNLSQANERLTRAIEGSRDGLWDWDLDTNEVYYSWGWRMMLDLPPGDTLNQPDDWFRLVHTDDLGPLRSRLAVHIEGVTPYFECQCRMKVPAGKYKWVLFRGMVNRTEDGHPYRITGTLTDLTNRSHHDIRTGLPFRSFFVDRLSQAIVQTQLSEASFYSVLQIDVDRFTAISEGFGHDMVDAMLISFAQRIENCLGDGDTLAFLGGNSFALLLMDQADLKTAKEVANQIHMQLIAPFSVYDTEVFTKASIGITRVNGQINNPNELLRQAQAAMKAARKMGSGHTQVFDSEMASKVRDSLTLESGLRSALDLKEFELHYQPQVCLATGKIKGVEALLRWRSKEEGFISPGRFIPIAEETDMILTIGEWVLRTACFQSVAWQKKGLPPLRVAVNLSERQFRARNLVGMVDQALQDSGLHPENLELEITEGIFMEDVEATFQILRNLRQRGIKIALDDFGTGFSSLSYLKRFPLTALKIDRAFVTDLTTDPGDAAICSSIVSLAHKFNFTVIAEGVETKEQLIILRAFQCDEMQGFYFSKAIPADKLEELLMSQTPRQNKT